MGDFSAFYGPSVSDKCVCRLVFTRTVKAHNDPRFAIRSTLLFLLSPRHPNYSAVRVLFFRSSLDHSQPLVRTNNARAVLSCPPAPPSIAYCCFSFLSTLSPKPSLYFLSCNTDITTVSQSVLFCPLFRTNVLVSAVLSSLTVCFTRSVSTRVCFFRARKTSFLMKSALYTCARTYKYL